MPTKHELTPDQRDRLKRFESEVIPKLKKKRSARETFDDLKLVFGGELAKILTTKPSNSVGIWHMPTDKAVAKATKLIFWRIVSYCRHDPESIALPEQIGAELATLQSTLRTTHSVIEDLHRDTLQQIRRHDVSAPRRLGKLARTIHGLAVTASAVANEYEPPRHQFDHGAATRAFEFLVLVHVRATGTYPALSPPTNKPSETQAAVYPSLNVIQIDAASADAYPRSAAFYRLIRRAADAVIAGRPSKRQKKGRTRDKHEVLTANLLADAVAYLRPITGRDEDTQS